MLDTYGTKKIVALFCASALVVLYVVSVEHQYFGYQMEPRPERSVSVPCADQLRDAKEHVTSPPNSGEEKPPPRRRKAVVILAVMRSGSSFLGEFFNQYPGVYYLFEPLHSVGIGAGALQKMTTIIHDLLKCNYTRVPDIYKNATSSDHVAKCGNNICFEGRSKFLWRNTDLCKKPWPNCGAYIDPEVLSRVCRQSVFPAVKLIRMSRLRDLEPLLADPELDLRVIQLVRDPRAIMSSRMNYKDLLKTDQRVEGNTKSLCGKFFENARYAENCILNGAARAAQMGCSTNMYNLWQGRFMRITHEYISERPHEALLAVYEFTELNPDSEVTKWLKNNTETEPSPRKRRSIPKNYYSTTRKSTAVLNQWRLQRDFEAVERIQEHCKSAMEMLGYKVVSNSSELKNVSLSLYDSALLPIRT